MSQSGSAKTEVSVELPAETIDDLRAFATANNVSMTEAIRRTAALGRYLWEKESAGGKVLVEERDRTFRRLTIRDIK